MTGDQFREAIEALGLSPSEAAKFLGVNSRTLRRWQTGQEIPKSVVLLLRTMLRLNLSVSEIESYAA
ncbi:helix-turn-helix domain-containing protein [Microvirga sp. Mcv34]|uniref:helix-turn-helix domain-containing protein n=1 Tax=Microvirga sp. Mcv34 TaxID=2926016 RepID=UPI0021C80456|nr:antitoxin Xre-like helix-turn-helix domain-containing protein [Microvirga sp. Mcv34]